MIARARMNSLSLLFARDLSREARGKTRVPLSLSLSLSLSLLNPLSSGFALSCFLKATQTNDKGARSKEEKCDDHHHLPLKFPLLRFTFVFCAGTRFFFSSFSSFLAGQKKKLKKQKYEGRKEGERPINFNWKRYFLFGPLFTKTSL